MGLLERFGLRAPDLMAAATDVSPTSAAALASPVLQLASPWQLPGNLSTVIGPDIFGLTGFEPMTRARAMSVPSVARARHIICGKIADQTLRAYRGDSAEPLPAAEQPSWIGRTDGPLHPWHRMLWTADDVFFTGFSLWRRTNDLDRNRPLACDRVARSRWDFNGTAIEVDGRPVSATSHQLIIGPHEGLLTFAAGAIRHAANLQAASDKAASTPAAQIDLHQTEGEPLTDPEIDALIDRWATARRGGNGGVSYSSKAINVRELSSVEGHLLIDGRNAAAVDVARAAGLPASRIDASTEQSLTYSTTVDNARELVDFGLSLYLGAIQASLSHDDLTPRGTRVAFDLSELLPPAGLTVGDTSPSVPAGQNAQSPTPTEGTTP